MAKVIVAPDLVIPDESPNRVFLAGAIDMGAAIDWQSWVIQRLKPWENITLLNPRRAAFTVDTLRYYGTELWGSIEEMISPLLKSIQDNQ